MKNEPYCENSYPDSDESLEHHIHNDICSDEVLNRITLHEANLAANIGTKRRHSTACPITNTTNDDTPQTQIKYIN